MLRTVSPQPPALVMPAASRSAKTSGSDAELEPVQLDALPRRQLGVAAAVAVRDLADRAQLRRREDPARDLHAQHERPDLRLVVVEAPPLEADDVLLGHPLVAGRDQRRQLLADAERRLVALDPLDGVALVDGLPGGRGGHPTEATRHYFTLGSSVVRLGCPGRAGPGGRPRGSPAARRARRRRPRRSRGRRPRRPGRRARRRRPPGSRPPSR